ncbi:hypothetical protein GGI07_000839 [Coemansia sp. Benny D115]|nr:hypothetical protein GGI07_000839 [Coemansia sp. Benny D115]
MPRKSRSNKKAGKKAGKKAFEQGQEPERRSDMQKRIDEAREKEARAAVEVIEENPDVVASASTTRLHDVNLKTRVVAMAVTDSLDSFVERRAQFSTLDADAQDGTGPNGASSQSSTGHGYYDKMWALLNPKHKFTQESDMLPCIEEFLQFVVFQIARVADQLDLYIAPTLEIYARPDPDATPGSDVDATRVDLALMYRNLSPEQLVEADYTGILGECDMLDLLPYSNMLAAIVAKTSQSHQKRAYEQMLMHTRNMYTCQHDRRFAWGFTVCDRAIRVCHTMHDNIFSTKAMDILSSDGRAEFVTLLCRMASCGMARLGFDPLIRYNERHERWEIEVCDDEDYAKGVNYRHKYSVTRMIHATRCLFGSRTRCFLCREMPAPAPGPGPSTAPAKGAAATAGREVVIKDTWALVPANSTGGADDSDSGDEVKLLRKINKALDGIKEVAGMYPTLIKGGAARFTQDITATRVWTVERIADFNKR